MAQRRNIYKDSCLPYSFNYKMRQIFHGENCPICGLKMYMYNSLTKPTIQHNIPISLGGKHSIENISIICLSCNVSIQNKITGDLNNKKVIDEWRKINGR